MQYPTPSELMQLAPTLLPELRIYVIKICRLKGMLRSDVTWLIVQPIKNASPIHDTDIVIMLCWPLSSFDVLMPLRSTARSRFLEWTTFK